MPRPIPSELLPQRYQAAGYHFAVPAGGSSRRDVDPATITSAILTFDGEPIVVTTATEDSSLDSPDLQVNGQLGLLLSKYRERSSSMEVHDRALVGVDGTDDAVLADISWGEADRHRSLLLCARLAGPRMLTVQVVYPATSADRLHGLASGIVDSVVVEPTDAPGTFTDRFTELDPGDGFA